MLGEGGGRSVAFTVVLDKANAGKHLHLLASDFCNGHMAVRNAVAFVAWKGLKPEPTTLEEAE